MKEFGIYTLKNNFIEEFSEQVPTLSYLSGTRRPFICVKVDGQNWLVYCGSINPLDLDYAQDLQKFRTFATIDRACEVRALHVFSDVTKLHSEPNFKSVVQYYNAFPVKAKYVKKYWDNPRDRRHRKHCVLDESLQPLVKRGLIKYKEARDSGILPGFLGERVKRRHTHFARYPIDYEAIQKALYRAQETLTVKRNENRTIKEDTQAARAGARDVKSFLRRYRKAESDEERKKIAAELRRQRPKLFTAAHKYAESSRLEATQQLKPER